jgi:hypothetical protein
MGLYQRITAINEHRENNHNHKAGNAKVLRLVMAVR